MDQVEIPWRFKLLDCCFADLLLESLPGPQPTIPKLPKVMQQIEEDERTVSRSLENPQTASL